MYRVDQKSKPPLIHQYIASYVRKALLFCMYTNSGTTASYQVVCTVCSIKYSMVLSSRYSDASVIY